MTTTMMMIIMVCVFEFRCSFTAQSVLWQASSLFQSEFSRLRGLMLLRQIPVSSLFLKVPSSPLRLLPRLFLSYILLLSFSSVYRRNFTSKIWPTQLEFLRVILHSNFGVSYTFVIPLRENFKCEIWGFVGGSPMLRVVIWQIATDVSGECVTFILESTSPRRTHPCPCLTQKIKVVRPSKRLCLQYNRRYETRFHIYSDTSANEWPC